MLLVVVCIDDKGGDMVVTLARECLGICGIAGVNNEADANDDDRTGGVDTEAAVEVTEMLKADDGDAAVKGMA